MSAVETPSKTSKATTTVDPIEALELKYGPEIEKRAEWVRTATGKLRDVKVGMGGFCAKLYDGLKALKVEDEDARARVLGHCGESPTTGKPYDWNTVQGMMTASRVISSLRPEQRPHVGTDAAMALKAITDEVTREAFVADRLESGGSFAVKGEDGLRAAVNTFLIESGDRKAPTASGIVKARVSKWKDSDDVAAARLAVDVIAASPEYADALHAVALLTAKVVLNTAKLKAEKRALVDVVDQLIFPNGKPARTPKPRAKRAAK